MLCNRLRSVFIMLFVFLLALNASAQTRQVTGTVTDSKDGTPVVGASVQVKGSNTGTVTGTDGTFSISVPAGAKDLEVSYVGYAAQTVSVDGVDNVTVSLVASASESLNEVVVIGYGTARKKDLTGSVASVSSKDFNKGLVNSPNDLLVNKVPGVEITSNSGMPGSASTVNIRGNNSIRGVSNPLYVVDGVPLDGRNAIPNFNTTFGTTPSNDPLLFINQFDIERVEVLKDASSAAIYGSRAANGVIVISTKKGVAKGIKLDVNAGVGFNAGLMKKFEVLNRDQFLNALSKYGVNNQDKGDNVDIFKEVANTKPSQTYGLALSGGGQAGTFRASFLANNNQGYLMGSDLKKYVGSIAGDYKFLNKKLSLSFRGVLGSVLQNSLPVSNTAGSAGNLISAMLQWNPTAALTTSDGSFVYPANGSGNPMALIAATNDKAKATGILGNISLGYKITKDLEYRIFYGINSGDGNRKANYYGFLLGITDIAGKGLAYIADQKLLSQTVTNTLSYNKDIANKLNLNAVMGTEYWVSKFETNFQSATNFTTNLKQNEITAPYTDDFSKAGILNPAVPYKDPNIELQSYFARGIFNYDDRYILTATFRADGSSKFGKNNKYGFFPSVGFRWSINREAFMQDNTVFSDLAFRASWGKTGNQEFPAGAAQEQFYKNPITGDISQINVANPNLRWEQTTAVNFGLDFAFLKGRINGAIEYYNKNTTDILFQSTAIQPAPASIYFVNLPANLKNEGMEFSLGGDIISQKNYGLSLRGYYTFNKNMINDFTQNGKDIQIITGEINGQGVSGTLGQIITNGYPANEFYLKPFNGFDANGNQLIGDNPTYSGNPNPRNSYGASLNIRAYKFNFVVNGGGSSGFLIYNNTATSVTNISGISGGRNIDFNAYNSPEKPSSPVAASTRFLESGNFFKIRNATLSYQFGTVAHKLKNFTANVTANNLLVITKFSGFDPEVNVDKTSNGYPSRSIEYIPYPTARTILVGLSFTL